jgi:phage shock protein A
MAEEPDSIVLRYLRRMDEKIDRLAEDVRELKLRMTTVEQQVAQLAATEASHYASTALRMDRLESRLERIERRLDLVEHAGG